MSRRQRFRQHLAIKSIDRLYSKRKLMPFTHCEFFWEYVKLAQAEFDCPIKKPTLKIEYLLTTHDDWATAPPVFQESI